MNRRSLIKSILGLAITPKILFEIDFSPAIEKPYFDIVKINARLKQLSGEYPNSLETYYKNNKS